MTIFRMPSSAPWKRYEYVDILSKLLFAAWIQLERFKFSIFSIAILIVIDATVERQRFVGESLSGCVHGRTQSLVMLAHAISYRSQ